MSQSSPESFLPLSVPVHQILLALAEGDRHGYAIIQSIRERTNGEVELTASTLYGALSRMLSDGMIVEVETDAESDPGRRRRTYSITAHGRAVGTAEAGRLARTLEQAASLGLGPAPAAESRGGVSS